MRRLLGWVCVVSALGLAIREARADDAPRAAVRAAIHGPGPQPIVWRSSPPRTMTVFYEDRGAPGALVHPPRDETERRVTVMLHGMCDEPAYECPHFVGAVTEHSWLVCPRATLRCDGGGSIWPWQTLRRAGVERLLLAAGDYDMMKWHMAAEARRLVRQGFPAAFISLGEIGHWFPEDFEERLRRGLRWMNGDDFAFEPSAPGEVVWRPGELDDGSRTTEQHLIDARHR